MKSIEIPEPCHENWNEMTPTERGAFCGKCQIDVVDFSNRSNHEVLEILKDNSGKHLCGRFKKTQLFELNQSYHDWNNQTSSVFRSKFLLACVMVFGMTLFTACIEDDDIMGDVAPVEYIQPIEDEESSCDTQILGKVAMPEEDYVRGNVLIEEQPADTNEIEEVYLKGEIYIPDEEKLIPTPQQEIDTITEIIKSSILSDRTEFDTGSSEMFDLVEIVKHSTAIIEKNLELKAAPNPVSGHTRITVKIPLDGYYSLELYSLSGALINSLIDGTFLQGVHEMNINLEPFETGVYILRFSSNDLSEEIKIQKVG